MKFTCPRATLLDPLLLASSVAPVRSVKPVLQNLRLDASDGVLEIQGTDLETSLRIRVQNVEVERAGSCLLPAAKLSSILRELESGPVTFDTDQLLCRIASAGASFRMQGVNPEEFPEVAGFSESVDVQIPAALLRKMTRKVVFAVSAEKTRYALNGVLLTLRKDSAVMVATDGRRLASMEAPMELSLPDGEKTAIVPPRALNQLDRVLTPEDEFVGLSIKDGTLLVQTQRATIAARLIEGKYPNLSSIIPAPGETKVSLDRSELMAALRKAAIMTSEESKPVRMSFSSDKLVISARSADVGDAEVELLIEGPSQSLDIGFNPEFLLDGLKALESDTAVLEMAASNKAGRLVGDPGYVYVVMPISLG